jgi:hypothetical protein
LFFWGWGFELDTRPLSERAKGVGKVPPFFFHQKLKDVSALVALTKAAPCTGFWKNYERRRACIGMKGAKASVILSRAAQLHRFGDQIYNFSPGFYLVYYGHIE